MRILHKWQGGVWAQQNLVGSCDFSCHCLIDQSIVHLQKYIPMSSQSHLLYVISQPFGKINNLDSLVIILRYASTSNDFHVYIPIFIDDSLSKSYFFCYLESDFGCKGSVFYDIRKCFKEKVKRLQFIGQDLPRIRFGINKQRKETFLGNQSTFLGMGTTFLGRQSTVSGKRY